MVHPMIVMLSRMASDAPLSLDRAKDDCGIVAMINTTANGRFRYVFTPEQP